MGAAACQCRPFRSGPERLSNEVLHLLEQLAVQHCFQAWSRIEKGRGLQGRSFFFCIFSSTFRFLFSGACPANSQPDTSCCTQLATFTYTAPKMTLISTKVLKKWYRLKMSPPRRFQTLYYRFSQLNRQRPSILKFKLQLGVFYTTCPCFRCRAKAAQERRRARSTNPAPNINTAFPY